MARVGLQPSVTGGEAIPVTEEFGSESTGIRSLDLTMGLRVGLWGESWSLLMPLVEFTVNRAPSCG